jgi:CP family cyanate transporter-like MFS transporter
MKSLHTNTSDRSGAPLLFLVGILVIAATLRAPITIMGPLMNQVQLHFGLGATQAGLLTALPLIAFVAMSPLVGLLAKSHRPERILFGGLIVLAAGIMLRSSGAPWALFAGTWLMGSGIATGNVLLPGLLKRHFTSQIARVTASYTLVMGLTSALASAIAVPLAQWHNNGWPVALGSVLLLPVVAMAIWLPLIPANTPPAISTASAVKGRRIWQSALAWQISLFMGLNSLMYYAAVSWLSSVLVNAGFSHQAAGLLQGGMHLASALVSLAILALGQRSKDQTWKALGSSLLTASGFAGLALSPEHAVFWTCMLGAGIGAGLILALSFLSLRASGAPEVTALAGMAQCVGYLLGAAGPPALGLLHELQGGWTLPLLEYAGLALVMACAGWLAGRDLQIN